jgi:hypothetical protein
MLKSIFAIVLIATLGAAAITTVVPYLEVSADPDIKDKAWTDGIQTPHAFCEKSDGGCKEHKETYGANVNKFARESCERLSGGEKCKQAK